MRIWKCSKNDHINPHPIKLYTSEIIFYKNFVLAGREFLQLSPFLNKNISTKAISTEMWRCWIGFKFQNFLNIIYDLLNVNIIKLHRSRAFNCLCEFDLLDEWNIKLFINPISTKSILEGINILKKTRNKVLVIEIYFLLYWTYQIKM